MNAIIQFSQNTPGILQNIIDFSVKGLILMAVVWATLWIFRYSSAALRHQLLSYALIGLILLPLCSFVIPPIYLQLIPSDLIIGNMNGRGDADIYGHVGESPTGIILGSSELPGKNKNTFNRLTQMPAVKGDIKAIHWSIWGIAMWLIVASFLLVLQIAKKNSVSAILKRAKRSTSESWSSIMAKVLEKYSLDKKPELLESDDIKTPLLTGLIKPRILIPTYAVDWPDESIEMILLHELGHLKRRDLFSQFLTQIVIVLHWLNPLVWLVSHRLFIERERASDDFVLNRGVKAPEYARHLLEVSKKVKTERLKLILNISALARGTDFKDRMLCVLDPGADRTPVNLTRNLLLALFVAVLVLPLAALKPWTSDKENISPIQDVSTIKDELHDEFSASNELPEELPNQNQVFTDTFGKVISPEQIELNMEAVNDRADIVRSSAWGALSKLENPEKVHGLIKAAMNSINDSMDIVRGDAAIILSRVKNPEEVEGLVEVLVGAMKDTFRIVRGSASKALAKIENPEKYPGLIESFVEGLEDEYWSVRWNAIRFLTRVNETNPVENLHAKLLRAAKDEHSSVRSAALSALQIVTK